MSNSFIKNKLLRCETCFMLRKIIIEPNFPETSVCLECICGEFREDIQQYVPELLKNTNFELKCRQCGKEDKDAVYCSTCRKLYCSNCGKKDKESNSNSQNPHYIINANKYDFYCVQHQEELVNAYCSNCSLNICQKCTNHKNHKVMVFSKVSPSPVQVTMMKESFNLTSDKMENIEEIFESLCSKQKNPQLNRQLKDVYNATYQDNKKIIELIKFFADMYNNNKNKNYAIIHNLSENMKFNVTQFMYNRNGNIDQQTVDFLNFLKRDFVLTQRAVVKARSYTTVAKPQMPVTQPKNVVNNTNTNKPSQQEPPKVGNNMQRMLGIFGGGGHPPQPKNTNPPPPIKKLQINPIFTQNQNTEHKKEENVPKKLKINPMFQNLPMQKPPQDKPKYNPVLQNKFPVNNNPSNTNNTTSNNNNQPPKNKIGDMLSKMQQQQPKKESDSKKPEIGRASCRERV